jgi:integrase
MSVNQLKDGRWICQYEKGKDKLRPTTNKKYFGRGDEALHLALAYNDSLGLGKGNIAATSPIFSELTNAYLNARRTSMTASTYEAVSVKMEKTILPLIGCTMAHKLTPDYLDQYVLNRSATVKNTTIHRELSDIRAILRWAVKRELIASNPMERFEMPKRDDARIQPPTKAEFDAILECASPHIQRAILVSYHTGLRPGKEELLRLTWDCVDFINKTLTVLSADKGGLPVRIVPLNSVILAHFGRWYDQDIKAEIRYIVHYKGKQIERIKKGWAAAKKRARITRRLRLYDLRHAFITVLLEGGADLKSVSEIVGHASPDMTMRVYQHVSTDLKRKAVQILE